MMQVLFVLITLINASYHIICFISVPFFTTRSVFGILLAKAASFSPPASSSIDAFILALVSRPGKYINAMAIEKRRKLILPNTFDQVDFGKEKKHLLFATRKSVINEESDNYNDGEPYSSVSVTEIFETTSQTRKKGTNQLTTSPMDKAGNWKSKKLSKSSTTILNDDLNRRSRSINNSRTAVGRGRSKKRSTLYHLLSSYHDHFLQLLTMEYKAEVRLFGTMSIYRTFES